MKAIRPLFRCKGRSPISSKNKVPFLAAKEGTLFLDEIGDLPLHLQPKMLRAIEYQEVKPVGSDKILKTNVRIIAATHQDLKKKVEKGEFREDLYYRLNVIQITLPSLRDRIEDIEKFIQHFCLRYGVQLSPEALILFCKHPWPGNIRELKNTIARAKALFINEVIDKKRAHLVLDQGQISSAEEIHTLSDMEKTMILKLLKKYRGHQRKVAKELAIPPSTLHDRLKKYSINAGAFKR